MQKEKLITYDLVERIKKGDPVAFELLFKIYYNPLVNFARVYVKRFDAADEIVQETFIKIWEVRETINEKLSLKAFLYRCVHNSCINYIKKMEVSSRLSEEYVQEIKYRMQILEQDIAQSDSDSPEEDDMDAVVQKIINELPEQCRQILLLSRFGDLTYQQIADKLSISINTVKTQLSRAFQKMRSGIKKV